MKLRTLMIALVLLALPGVASADGIPSRSASYCCESPTWSGIYAGFYAGGAWADTDWAFPFPEAFNTAIGQHFSTSPQGAIVGMQAGFNYQLGYFLAGAETSFAGSNMQDTLTGPVTAPFPGDRLRTEVSNLFTTTGRFGVVADKLLLYGKAGYANSNVAVRAFSPVPGITAHDNRASDGWTVGGGLEYRLRRSLVLGIEYNCVDLQ